MRFKYYNRRPDGKKLEDCVCRAISTATGLKYQDVNELLSIVAKINDCEKLCVCCYHSLLDDVLDYPCYDGEGKTVKDIVNKYDDCRLILRMEGHLSCAIYGTLLDIWDCSKRKVDCFWIIGD